MALIAQGLEWHRQGRQVLHGLDLELAAGTLTVVLGPNGAGKSTLLQLLSGLESPTSGAVRLDGEALHGWSEPQRARQLAVMTQDQPLDFPFSVEEVVRLGAWPLGLSPQQEADHGRRWLQRLDLAQLAGRNYLQLSGGERQRVQLARVLAQCGEQSRVLLLDEPVSAMDLRHQHLCLRQLRRLADAGMAVLLILHDLALAAQYGDRVLLLKDGRALAQGPVPEVMTAALLSQLFEVGVDVRFEDGVLRFSSFVADDAFQA
ncbi:hemin import ATP-binding protein HmuV [Marinobacterium nitratireducens]|uniref:Hemin import ATP-binding protein HmuV n=1 Tax=Marinobacterium nitratireducens TaxID=518897 RepID=A0A918DYP8_9GAMM|nr:heme ABC transporter ATP-binding protein [Marinobacterium nitratireducens]GGO88548.1 hemin import ATP-binding protein HmuV [Marinobacterium nitratireducens]